MNEIKRNKIRKIYKKFDKFIFARSQSFFPENHFYIYAQLDSFIFLVSKNLQLDPYFKDHHLLIF